MILQIGSVKLPASKNSTAALVPQVSRVRAISGRMISKFSYEKWRLTYQLPDDSALELDYQAQVYSVALAAQSGNVDVTFINPYTNERQTATCKCTEMETPSILTMDNGIPSHYVGLNLVFEEV